MSHANGEPSPLDCAGIRRSPRASQRGEEMEVWTTQLSSTVMLTAHGGSEAGGGGAVERMFGPDSPFINPDY